MFKIIFFYILPINVSLAVEVKVQYNNFSSIINSTTTEITYKDTSTDLGLFKKKCNAHIVERLYKEFNDQNRNLTFEKIQDHPMTIIRDEVKQTIDQRSPKGQFFYNYIDIIKRAKIEELLNCPTP